jgi:aspartyl/asparaginyl-tRNA synthetase
MDVGESYIKYIGKYLLDKYSDDLKNLDNFISKGIIEKLGSKGSRIPKVFFLEIRTILSVDKITKCICCRKGKCQ